MGRQAANSGPGPSAVERRQSGRFGTPAVTGWVRGKMKKNKTKLRRKLENSNQGESWAHWVLLLYSLLVTLLYGPWIRDGRDPPTCTWQCLLRPPPPQRPGSVCSPRSLHHVNGSDGCTGEAPGTPARAPGPHSPGRLHDRGPEGWRGVHSPGCGPGACLFIPPPAPGSFGDTASFVPLGLG